MVPESQRPELLMSFAVVPELELPGVPDALPVTLPGELGFWGAENYVHQREVFLGFFKPLMSCLYFFRAVRSPFTWNLKSRNHGSRPFSSLTLCSDCRRVKADAKWREARGPGSWFRLVSYTGTRHWYRCPACDFYPSLLIRHQWSLSHNDQKTQSLKQYHKVTLIPQVWLWMHFFLRDRGHFRKQQPRRQLCMMTCKCSWRTGAKSKSWQ